MKFKVGDLVSCYDQLQFQMSIFKKCQVTKYPITIEINGNKYDNGVEIKASNGKKYEVLNNNVKPYIEPEIKEK
jgi:hypothetical protein